MIKTSNKSNLILLLSVTVIWGVIGTKIFYYFNAGNDSEITGNAILEFEAAVNDEDINPGDVTKNVSYIDLERDPFQLKKRAVIKRKKEVPVERPEIENDIDFVISGVILKEDRKLVILQDRTNNNTMFLREGEKYKNLKINFISPTSVSLLQNNKEKKITIQ